MTNQIFGKLKVLYRYDQYSGDGYYWRRGNANWHGPFPDEEQAKTHADTFFG